MKIIDYYKERKQRKLEKRAQESRKVRIFKTIGGTILYVLIVLVLVYYMPKGLSYALNTEYPMAAITSGSMWPELKKGDLVFVQGVDAKKELQIGDIVVYSNPPTAGAGGGASEKGFTIHRIIELREDTLVTKGDANNISDSPVKYEDIIGRLYKIKGWNAKLPKLGFISIMVNK